MTQVQKLPDEKFRIVALTDIDHSFLVEAGAGSGKTSIMAGRVAVLLARGVAPKTIAAITFTEFAASELRIRIEKYVNDLCKGKVTRDIELAFPSGVSPEEMKNLLKAQRALDELTCTTIHGFAQALIRPYPSEAGIDPGAEIIDPAEGDIAFDELYRIWLKRHLSEEDDNDVIAELILGDEKRGEKLVRSIADFLRHNRDARPPSHFWSNVACRAFIEAAKAFDEEISRFDFLEDKTANACQAFADIANTLAVPELRSGNVTSRTLVAVANIPRDGSCFTKNGTKRQLRAKGAWEKAAKSAGQPKTEGVIAFQACLGRYDACHAAFITVLEAVAGELLARIFDALKEFLEEWQDYKRAAALLDFDDLLHTARNLLADKNVRQALAQRYRHVLVDEFQDTDPLQIDILWRICGEAPEDGNTESLARKIRPGALFVVGDPKQAIYRFRGADVHAYVSAREAMGKDACLEIIANFRSREPILDFVNTAFETPLAVEAGQPGFTPLTATCRGGDGLAVRALRVVIDEDEVDASLLRDAEAERVAELCKHLAGNAEVRDGDGTRPCRFGDIALLAPVGTELWRFEKALEDRGIPVSTQAGKGFFRRQEVQDLIALTCAMADARDTLALGALLRGPFVGLTEEELLDIAEGLPADPNEPDQLMNLSLWTSPEQIQHELARRVLELLQSLARQASRTTPYMLLASAVSLLHLRAQLRARWSNPDRALANVDLFLEMARAYDVRGLRAFARDMREKWGDDQVRVVEGRPDAEEHAVSLITIHSAKGLEWRIVIPINMTGDPRAESGLMHDRRAGEFSIPILGIETESYAAIKAWEEAESDRERIRLWYVATTRACDLLVLPKHTAPLSNKCWGRLMEWGIEALPAIDPEDFKQAAAPLADPPENGQTLGQFAEEAKKIADATLSIKWRRPSLHEDGPPAPEPSPIFADPESVEEELPRVEVKGSTKRGRILHKLMEEVLTGETPESPLDLEARALELLVQLGETAAEDPKIGISPEELAKTVLTTLALPEVAALRPRLVPEITVFGSHRNGMEEMLVSGIADALVWDEDGRIEAIVDWKSDVEVLPDKAAHYLEQLRTYRDETGAERAFLVFMTSSQVMHA